MGELLQAVMEFKRNVKQEYNLNEEYMTNFQVDQECNFFSSRGSTGLCSFAVCLINSIIVNLMMGY